MVDVSNKTIVALLAVALVVTVAGTIISVSKLNQLSYPTWRVSSFGLTGAPVGGSGDTNITIESIASISVSGGNASGSVNGTLISFGSGAVNQTCLFCIMDSNGMNMSYFANNSDTYTSSITGTQAGVSAAGGVCCRFSSVVAFSGPGNSGFLIENDGNQNLSVNYTCSGNCTHATYIGGTRNTRFGGLEIKVTPNSVAGQIGELGQADTNPSCLGGGILYRTNGWNITNMSGLNTTNEVPGTAACGADGNDDSLNAGENGNCTGFPAGLYTSITAGGHWLCGNRTSFPLSHEPDIDAAVVDINVTIPANAPATGVRSSIRLTFNALSAG